MKKILVIVLALALVIGVSATAYAEASNRAKEVTEENKGKALGIEKQEEREGRLMLLFELYYPDGMEALKEVKEGHKDFHEQAKEDALNHREAVKEDFEEIREAVENGSITKREGKVQLINLRMDIRLMRNDLDAIRLEKIDSQTTIHDKLAQLRAEIKALLETEPIDGDAIAILLEESLGLLEEHLENDIYFHGLMQDTAAVYGY